VELHYYLQERGVYVEGNYLMSRLSLLLGRVRSELRRLRHLESLSPTEVTGVEELLDSVEEIQEEDLECPEKILYFDGRRLYTLDVESLGDGEPEE